MKVKWLLAAQRNLISEAEYIRKENPSASVEMARTIQDRTAYLADHPFMGRAGRIPETRELIISGTPYIVPYRVKKDVVEILRVIHASRDWPKKV